MYKRGNVLRPDRHRARVAYVTCVQSGHALPPLPLLLLLLLSTLLLLLAIPTAQSSSGSERTMHSGGVGALPEGTGWVCAHII